MYIYPKIKIIFQGCEGSIKIRTVIYFEGIRGNQQMYCYLFRGHEGSIKICYVSYLCFIHFFAAACMFFTRII